jgi:psiF repeat
MIRQVLAAAMASAFLAAAAAPAAGAQDKPPTPQQQKMKDCAVKWKDEKAKTGAKGRDAYRTFMRGCMTAQ